MSDIEDMIKRLAEAAELAKEVARLEHELAPKKRLLEKLMAGGMAGSMDGERSSDPGLGFSMPDVTNMNKTRSVLAILKANRGRPFDGAEIAEAIKVEDANIIRTLLNRLARQGEIRRDKRGKYVYGNRTS